MVRNESNASESSWTWFATTACPLLAATLGPFACAMNICALASSWRVPLEAPGSTRPVQSGGDPFWVLALTAIALIAALAANVALFLNMAGILAFWMAQFVTIAGFALGGALLLINTIVLTRPSAASYMLTGAFFYGFLAAVTYSVIALLMCWAYWGTRVRNRPDRFELTLGQRSLMLHVITFMTYLLLGALLFSFIEDWDFLDAVFWADVTLLTVGLGDYCPVTILGRVLLLPFAIFGILLIGMVVANTRRLVLDRGREKMSARLTEKRRAAAVRDVDDRRQTIRISRFSKADFSTDSRLSPAQRREEEFNIMRQVLAAAEHEHRWVSLSASVPFALLLWLGGAAVFTICERRQQWGYFDSTYFTFVSLLTIGYGDLDPISPAGQTFYVFWSLLALPSLTILISDLSETVVRLVSNLTTWFDSVTLSSADGEPKRELPKLTTALLPKIRRFFSRRVVPHHRKDGHTIPHVDREAKLKHHARMREHLAKALESHIEQEELEAIKDATARGDTLERDIHFYHYVLAREAAKVQKDIGRSPPKKYSWLEWEHFLRLMDNEDDREDGEARRPSVMTPIPPEPPAKKLEGKPNGDSGARLEVPANPQLLPGSVAQDAENQIPKVDGNIDRETEVRKIRSGKLRGRQFRRGPEKRELSTEWSWLSENSPLVSYQTESQWIMEHLSEALERELNRQRKGNQRRPPIGMADAVLMMAFE